MIHAMFCRQPAALGGHATITSIGGVSCPEKVPPSQHVAAELLLPCRVLLPGAYGPIWSWQDDTDGEWFVQPV